MTLGRLSNATQSCLSLRSLAFPAVILGQGEWATVAGSIQKKVALFPSLTGKVSDEQALLHRHLEEAESRIKRGQRNVDHQRKAVSDLERDSQDATMAVHAADWDQLVK